MLQELHITDFVVTDQLRLRFGPGLNLLTGETGSGKSIIVDALALLFGARARAEVIRPGKYSARILGIFSSNGSPKLQAILDEAGLELDQNELIIGREVLENGKSRAHVNERPVTATLLRKLAPFLGDIHGQHEQQHLFSPRTQLDMLDTFADTTMIARDASSIYSSWQTVHKELNQLKDTEQERLRTLDLCVSQFQEITQAAPETEEIAQLEKEGHLLENLERVQQAVASAYDNLYDSATSASAQIKAAQHSIEALASLDKTFQTMTETLSSVRADVDDTAFGLHSFLSQLEPNPERRQEIEDRIALLKQLQRKYGRTIEEVLSHGEHLKTKIDDLRSSGERPEILEAKHRTLSEQYQATTTELSQRRRKAADCLEKLVEAEFRDLAMEKTRFQVKFESLEKSETKWSSNGPDHIDFTISTNPGQPLRSLTQVASGGELSRITLALKTCLLETEGIEKESAPRTLVFDEIDSGIGGRVAEAVGRRLEKLARNHQVLCVTHLAQIAGFADVHFVVAKHHQDKTTVASIEKLSVKQRIEELARMLSGETVTPAALRHAEQMIKRDNTDGNAS